MAIFNCLRSQLSLIHGWILNFEEQVESLPTSTILLSWLNARLKTLRWWLNKETHRVMPLRLVSWWRQPGIRYSKIGWQVFRERKRQRSLGAWTRESGIIYCLAGLDGKAPKKGKQRGLMLGWDCLVLPAATVAPRIVCVSLVTMFFARYKVSEVAKLGDIDRTCDAWKCFLV